MGCLPFVMPAQNQEYCHFVQYARFVENAKHLTKNMVWNTAT